MLIAVRSAGAMRVGTRIVRLMRWVDNRLARGVCRRFWCCVLKVCCSGSALASFEHQDWNWDTKQDQDANERDCRDASEIFWAHECDEHADPCKHGECADREEDTPLKTAVAWWGSGGAGMRNRWTHHLGGILSESGKERGLGNAWGSGYSVNPLQTRARSKVSVSGVDRAVNRT